MAKEVKADVGEFGGLRPRQQVRPIKLVTVDPIMWFKGPRAEQAERRGEHNFLFDEGLKGAEVAISEIGVTIKTKMFAQVMIPWSYVTSFWYEDLA
jgi:hypothetical protein